MEEFCEFIPIRRSNSATRSCNVNTNSINCPFDSASSASRPNRPFSFAVLTHSSLADRTPQEQYYFVRPTERLQKNELKPHLRKCWVIPPDKNAQFVACMEDVLDVYHLPYDPNWPQVCMDEQPVQLVKDTRTPISAAPGRPLQYDYEYERNGTANIFVFVEPLKGRRHVNVTARRTAIDWAHEIQELLDVRYPEAEGIRLVMDNLNTHVVASLYEAFAPPEARRVAAKLDIHYTPKHGSWLNIAEIELAALTKQCLNRRIPDRHTLQLETARWEQDRNGRQKGVDWRFTTEDARIKLKRLYPQIET